MSSFAEYRYDRERNRYWEKTSSGETYCRIDTDNPTGFSRVLVETDGVRKCPCPLYSITVEGLSHHRSSW